MRRRWATSRRSRPGRASTADRCEPLRLARSAVRRAGRFRSSLRATTVDAAVLYRRTGLVVQVAMPGLAITDDEQERIFSDIDSVRRLRDGWRPARHPGAGRRGHGHRPARARADLSHAAATAALLNGSRKPRLRFRARCRGEEVDWGRRSTRRRSSWGS
jgi:hypothetical protein